MEDDSVLKIYTWFCHLHPEDMNSLTMFDQQYAAALAAAEHIKTHDA